MQKVEGSSPFIRFTKAPRKRGFPFPPGQLPKPVKGFVYKTVCVRVLRSWNRRDLPATNLSEQCPDLSMKWLHILVLDLVFARDLLGHQL